MTFILQGKKKSLYSAPYKSIQTLGKGLPEQRYVTLLNSHTLPLYQAVCSTASTIRLSYLSSLASVGGFQPNLF